LPIVSSKVGLTPKLQVKFGFEKVEVAFGNILLHIQFAKLKWWKPLIGLGGVLDKP